MRAGRAEGWGWSWGVLGRGMFRGRSWGSGGGADRGVATVWAAVTVAGLCTVFAVVLALGQAVAARHRAGGAADLAALAAADRALEGAEAACEAARRVALAQDAVVVRCAVEGEVADVTARSGFGPYLPAVRARAGPPAGPSGRAPTDAPARPPADPSGDGPAEPRGGHRADPLAGGPSDAPARPPADPSGRSLGTDSRRFPGRGFG
ncbi:Rv3654c family TadE-like protein [Streptomyces sp. CAI-121]|uniref:Rv3654c family TadE-like protein n=2 Tax=unclassified Streptomyces TaxID=2593676 RepID=UPI002814D192|nr:Rv3654c family TadE-like protein [Streptomyces sp. CAI-121]